MVRIIIAGGRNFDDYNLLRNSVDGFIRENKLSDITIIEGGANGADALGRVYAIERGYPYETFKADWNKYKKAAGVIRNTEMGKTATHVLAFWDGESKGTKHMISVAQKRNLPLLVIGYKNS